MTDQEWRQAADGQWYPVNEPYQRSQVTARSWWIAGVAMAVLAVVLVVGFVVVDFGDAARDDAYDTLDRVWAGMDTQQRLGMCAEVRTAGVSAAAAAFDAETSLEAEHVAEWLRGRCGD